MREEREKEEERKKKWVVLYNTNTALKVETIELKRWKQSFQLLFPSFFSFAPPRTII